MELTREQIAEIDRNARAYGYEVGKGHPLVEELTVISEDNPFKDLNWRDHVVHTFCGFTLDEAVCACGCSGYDDRCPLYLKHYHGITQVPESHTCCKIPGRE